MPTVPGRLYRTADGYKHPLPRSRLAKNITDRRLHRLPRLAAVPAAAAVVEQPPVNGCNSDVRQESGFRLSIFAIDRIIAGGSYKTWYF